MEERDEIIKWWDYWRGEIASGHTGSAPRDWFESVLDQFEEKLEEKPMNSLKEVALFLIEKAYELPPEYFLESCKLIQAAEILDKDIVQSEINKGKSNG